MNKRRSVYSIRIGGICCEHCRTAIRTALLAEKGVESVRVSGKPAAVRADVPVSRLIGDHLDKAVRIWYSTENRMTERTKKMRGRVHHAGRYA